MTTQAKRLLSLGLPIELVDGEVATARFSLGALARCEEQYGNLAGTHRELLWLVEQRAAGFPDPVAARLAAMLRCVLGHATEVASEPPWCVEALMEAWLEAFPSVEDDAPKA